MCVHTWAYLSQCITTHRSIRILFLTIRSWSKGLPTSLSLSYVYIFPSLCWSITLPAADTEGTLSSPLLGSGHSSRIRGGHQTQGSFGEIIAVIGFMAEGIICLLRGLAHIGTSTHAQAHKQSPPVPTVTLSPLPRWQAEALDLPPPVIICWREVQPKVLAGQPGKTNTQTCVDTDSCKNNDLEDTDLYEHRSPRTAPSIPLASTSTKTQHWENPRSAPQQCKNYESWGVH